MTLFPRNQPLEVATSMGSRPGGRASRTEVTGLLGTGFSTELWKSLWVFGQAICFICKTWMVLFHIALLCSIRGLPLITCP
jgi:hypothetical protein